MARFFCLTLAAALAPLFCIASASVLGAVVTGTHTRTARSRVINDKNNHEITFYGDLL